MVAYILSIALYGSPESQNIRLRTLPLALSTTHDSLIYGSHLSRRFGTNVDIRPSIIPRQAERINEQMISASQNRAFTMT